LKVRQNLTNLTHSLALKRATETTAFSRQVLNTFITQPSEVWRVGQAFVLRDSSRSLNAPAHHTIAVVY